MMCTCLEHHWNHSQNDPARLSFDANQAFCSAEQAQAPHQEALSLELENNELLAKARTRSRLAQRRHRQKIKSLSNSSIERNQDGLGSVQKRPLAQSRGVHQQTGPGGREPFQDCDMAHKDDGNGRQYSDTISNANTSQDPSLQVVDPHSIDLCSWTPSEEIEALIRSSTSASTTSSLDRDKNSRGLPANNSVGAFNTSFLTTDTGKLDALCQNTTQHHQHTHPEYTYSFDTAVPVSFSLGHDAPSTDINEHASVQLEKDTSCITTSYDRHLRHTHSSALPYTSSSSQPKDVNPHRRLSQTTNPYPANALPTPPLCTPLQPSNPPPTLPDPSPPFPYCAFHPPSTPITTTSHPHFPPKTPPHATVPYAPSDQLTRLTHLLDLIDAYGFDSLDALAITYYTASFPAGHPLRAAQSLSRRRYLRQLLGALQESASGWGEEQGRGWKEGVLGGVGEILKEEIRGLRAERGMGGEGVGDNGGGEARERLVRRLEGVFGDEEGREGMREWKRIVRERATETWSLLTELGNAVGGDEGVGRPGENAQIVAAFLCVLVGR